MEELDVVVDVSNICRDPGVPPEGRCRLGRYIALLESIAESFGEDAAVLGVADASLIHGFSDAERRTYRRRVDAGEILVEPKADVRLLRLAGEHGAKVVSRDGFTAHRKEFPWIAHSEGVFWDWEMAGSKLQLRPREMRTYLAFDVSRAADVDDLEMGHRLQGRRLEDVLRHRWSCSNSACLSHRFSGTPTPRWDGDSYRCPACSSTMVRGEERPRAVQLKLTGDTGPGRRPVVDQGTTLTFGRTTSDLDLSELLNPDALARVSGEHARITVDASSWTVEDLGSRNGTWIGRWDGESGARQPWSRIESGRPVPLGERDSISIADVLRIDRSGVLNAGL